MGRIATERAIFGNTFGAFMGGLSGSYNPPSGFFGSAAYHPSYMVGAGIRFATYGTVTGGVQAGKNALPLLGAAASGPYHLGRDYLKWRGDAARTLKINKAEADRLSARQAHTTLSDSELQTIEKYGRELNNEPLGAWDVKGRVDRMIEGPYKPRKFGVRNWSEHLAQGTKNYTKLMLSPTNWGIHVAFASLMSSDNLLDPKEGIGRMFAESVLGEAGFMAGAAIGPAIASAAIPGSALAAGAGMLAGGFAGALALSAIPAAISSYSDWGNANGRKGKPFRSNFINSERAATMRQRGLQSIYRSQMSARSALGSESLSYHA